MPARITVTMMTTIAQTRTSISSLVSSRLSLLLYNLFLQNRRYQVIGALLSKQTLRALTFCVLEVIRVLAWIAITITAPNKKKNKQPPHFSQPSSNCFLNSITLLSIFFALASSVLKSIKRNPPKVKNITRTNIKTMLPTIAATYLRCAA